MTDLPTVERLRELFEYDPETGRLFWRWRSELSEWWNGRYAGKEAGTVDGDGYRRVVIDGRRYQEHRVIYAMCNGAWPAGRLDHIDGDRANNRAQNLRPATNAENIWNSKLRVTNTSGYRGVTWRARYRRWRATIMVEGKEIFLGHFADRGAAGLAYAHAAVVLHGEFVPHETQAVLTADSAMRDAFEMRMSAPGGLIF